MVIDCQRVKTLVKGFSLKNSFGQIVLFLFSFEKIFLYLSWCFSWSSCISWVFFLNLHLNLDSWLNYSLILESWFLTWVFGIIKISLEALLLQGLLVGVINRLLKHFVGSFDEISYYTQLKECLSWFLCETFGLIKEFYYLWQIVINLSSFQDWGIVLSISFF